MTLSRDLVSHHIQRHSTKSTDRTYLLPCSLWLTFLVHQTSFIYCWESAFYIAFVEKPTSRYLICWEVLPPSSYCGFDIYSPRSHLLGCDFLWSNSVGIWTTSYSLTTASWWYVHQSILQPGWSLAVWQGSVLDPHEALRLWNRHASGEDTACWTQQIRLPGEWIAPVAVKQ